MGRLYISLHLPSFTIKKSTTCTINMLYMDGMGKFMKPMQFVKKGRQILCEAEAMLRGLFYLNFAERMLGIAVKPLIY